MQYGPMSYKVKDNRKEEQTEITEIRKICSCTGTVWFTGCSRRWLVSIMSSQVGFISAIYIQNNVPPEPATQEQNRTQDHECEQGKNLKK